MTYARFVAIGDSTVEGLDDPDGRGSYRGWADRLAAILAAHNPTLLYANLGVRGQTMGQVRRSQFEPALAMSPDLVALVAGTNDLMRSSFDAGRVAGELEQMQRAFIAAGATVVTFTLPDLTPVMPLARIIRTRVEQLAEAIRACCAATSARLCDLASVPVATDPRLWSDDRLHANSLGHERIARALAWTLQLPGSDSSWADPLPAVPPPGPTSLVAAEVAWMRNHFVPWLWRHARGRSSGDGVSARRPVLEAVASESSELRVPRSERPSL